MTYAWFLPALLGFGLAPRFGAQAKPPDGCKLLTLDNVTATLGGGFTLGPTMALINTSEMSACLYQKGSANSVGIAVLGVGAPGVNAKAAVLQRQERQKAHGRTVTPLPGVCQAAFTVVITPKNTTLIAAKGPWQLEFQVLVGGKPDAEAEQQFAKAACARLP